MVHRHVSNGAHTDAIYRMHRTKQDNDIRAKSRRQAFLIENSKKQVTRTFDNGLSTVNGTLSAETRELDIGRVEKDVRLLKSKASQVKDIFDRVEIRFVPMEGEMCYINGGMGGGGGDESQLESDRRALVQPVKNASMAYYFQLKV